MPTFLTLMLVPVVYSLLARFTQAKRVQDTPTEQRDDTREGLEV